ncbi:MAG: Fic family protein [Bacilli bacterium]
MSEKELDSSINDYIETETPNNYVKQQEWDMAIGLQEVDNLKPSKYLEKLLQENVTGEKTIYEVEKELKEYYVEKEKNNEVNHNELECDLVSTRIVELLQENNFELSIDYLKYVHKYLFQDVYEFAGEFRKVDFSKHERILNNDSVAYGDHKLLEQSLDYDITLEKNKNYNEMNIVDVINNITDFSSRIWQIHPFREGNTRTTAIFIEKYLVSLGYNVDNTLFKDKSVYFRNALVRSNYFNNYLNIKEDNSFLIKFYENLLLGKNNNLHSRDLIVEKLFNKEN